MSARIASYGARHIFGHVVAVTAAGLMTGHDSPLWCVRVVRLDYTNQFSSEERNRARSC